MYTLTDFKLRICTIRQEVECVGSSVKLSHMYLTCKSWECLQHYFIVVVFVNLVSMGVLAVVTTWRGLFSYDTRDLVLDGLAIIFVLLMTPNITKIMPV